VFQHFPDCSREARLSHGLQRRVGAAQLLATVRHLCLYPSRVGSRGISRLQQRPLDAECDVDGTAELFPA
jgi:hypothetical protein